MHPKRYSQIERALNILDESTSVDILKDDLYLLFIFKKTERIAAAAYLLTGLMSDSEPLKGSIRLAALSLLKDMLSLGERALHQSAELIGESARALAELISLIDLAHVCELISPMNFSILRKELALLHEALATRGKSGTQTGSGMSIGEGFFGISKLIFDERPAPAFHGSGATIGSISELEKFRPIKDTYKGQTMSDSNVLYGDKDNKGEGRFPVERQQSAPRTKEPNAATAEVKTARKQKILDLVREKKSTMIKDFSTVIQGCSEKTIQRLLAELVEAGVLKREGERRWSRYSIRT